MASKWNFSHCTEGHHYSNFKMMRIYPSFLKICGRRYLLIGFVNSPDTYVNVDEDSRWRNRRVSTTLNSIRYY